MSSYYGFFEFDTKKRAKYSKKTIDNTSQNKFELFNNSSWDNNYDNAAIQTIGNLT